MAEEMQEIQDVCLCFEGDKAQTRVGGEWFVTAADVNFSGSVQSGKIQFTGDQVMSVKDKPEFNLAVKPGGYEDELIKYPGSVLDTPDKLPLPVEIRRLTPQQKVDVIRRNAKKIKDRFQRALNNRFSDQAMANTNN
jgi:hypothetical protein